MHKILTLLLLSISSGLLQAASAPETSPLNGHNFDYRQNWALYAAEPSPWLTYVSQRATVLRTPEGTEIENKPEQGTALSVPVLLKSQGKLFSLWREKTTSKRLMFATDESGNGKEWGAPIVLDTESEALTRMYLAANASGIYALWLGERPDDGVTPQKNQKRPRSYNLYFKHSADSGKTFTDTFKVMPGIYPTWVVTDDLVAVFSAIPHEDGKKYMAMRRYDPTSKKFGEAIRIREYPPTISPFFQAFQSGSRIFLMWMAHYGVDMNEFHLEGAYSDDQGKTWQDFRPKSPRNDAHSKIEVAAPGDGHIYVVYSSAEYGNKASKDSVYLVRSDDNGSTWFDPMEIRRSPDRKTRASYPSIAAGKDGEVVVAWEDWRHIRPVVYMNYSNDHGKTWQANDVPLTNPGSNTLMPVTKNTLLRGEKGFQLVVEQPKDDTLQSRDLRLIRFAPGENAASLETSAADESSLRNRFNTYWDAFIKSDWAAAYPLNDPYFRGVVNQENYVKSRGKIKYHQYEIKSISIQGNIAKVEAEITYSVPPMKTADNKEFSRPETKIFVTETWVYVDNNWFREYYDEQSEKAFTRY